MTLIPAIYEAVQRLAGQAMDFSKIERSIVCHPDGSPETNADHTVMLCWIAPSLAALLYPDLEPGLVARYAAVHDAAELYAGDTPTMPHLSGPEQRAKELREMKAVATLEEEYRRRLPLFADDLTRYEQQDDPEARFVRFLDKLMPTLVVVINGGIGILEASMDSEQVRAFDLEKRTRLWARYGEEFPALHDLLTLAQQHAFSAVLEEERNRGASAKRAELREAEQRLRDLQDAERNLHTNPSAAPVRVSPYKGGVREIT